MRQVHAFLERINIRTHNEHAIEAGFHGIKIDLREVETQIESLENWSEDEKQMFSKTIKERFQAKILEKAKQKEKNV